MSAYTLVNLKEIEDVGGAAHTPGFEARTVRQHLDSQHLGLGFFHYPAGFRAPIGHAHHEQEEVYVVIEGSGRMRLDGDVVELNRWDVVRVAPQTVRALEGGDAGLTLLVAASARSGKSDMIVHRDWWVDD
jgi:mannose-6-phosphate isomerase-like protein (cupin superfamily)